MNVIRLRAARLASLAATLFFIHIAGAQTPPGPLQWDTFGTQDDRPQVDVKPGQAKLIFLRPAADKSRQGPVDILVNGRLHTALLPGAFSELDLCAGPARLDVGGQDAAGAAARMGQTIEAPAQRITHVLVQSPSAGAVFRTNLSAEQAQAMLPDLRRQVHAVSRVPAPKDCAQPATAPVAAVPPMAKNVEPPPAPVQRITLASEMLFSFNGSKPQHLSEQGHTEIVKVARQLQTQIQPGQTVVVQGHTDPMGSNALNQRLSLERAQTVSQILVDSGLPAKQVRPQGLGSSQLIVKDCERLAPKREDKILCNRPNRRVEIIVSPVKN